MVKVRSIKAIGRHLSKIFLGLVLLVSISGRADPVREAFSLWQRYTIDDTSQRADGVRLADLNRDGLSDIATGWEEGGLIRVYFNPGKERVRDPSHRNTSLPADATLPTTGRA